MKTCVKNLLLQASHWLALALSVQTFSLAALAQSPLSDSFDPGADGDVYCVAVQGDGKVLIGGGFSTLDGQSRIGFGRLNADGTLDTSFSPGLDGSVDCLAVQADARILVGGSFSTLGGQSRTNIGRLNADGTLDTSFNPGTDGHLNSLAVQADGKILVGGSFSTLGGQSRTNIGRLNADGTLDTSFNPGAGGTNGPEVLCLAMQADGKILVGGYFTIMGGQSCTNIGRLNANGTLDTSFNVGADGGVNSLAVQGDGKIVVGGYFSPLGGLGRLNADGTLDTSFNPGAGYSVLSLTVQADERILVGGDFDTLGAQTYVNLGRLNADGTLDTSFNPGVVSGVEPGGLYRSLVGSLAVQADGRVLVGGFFGALGGQSRTNIGRLYNTDPATQSLTFDGSTLTWMRGGTSPEVWRTTFDYSPDGSSWTNLGAGSRIAGGWQLTGLALPTNTNFRARGFTGDGVGSSWFVETIVGPPIIVEQPTSLTNKAADSVQFSVYAGGDEPLSYQWQKDGQNLVDGGNVTGAATASVTLSNVLGADAGRFSVVITNAGGSVTSAVANLTVIDPWIKLQPIAQDKNLRDSVTFSVGAIGTMPLSYQWRKDGVIQGGATQSSLTLTNLQRADAGTYDVVVSNTWGSVTSATAQLGFFAGADGPVSALAVQADGKILVGGQFTMLDGRNYTNIGRLNADGTPDTNFNPGTGGTNGPYVSCLAVQADGKILVGGQFTTLDAQNRNSIGRLNGDGTLDTSFNPGVAGAAHGDAPVAALAVQADGKILVAGSFDSLGGQSRTNIGRLNGDGTLDPGFDPAIGSRSYPVPSSAVYSLAIQADGKILVGGTFDSLGGQNRNSVGRLNSDGTLDTSFNSVGQGYILGRVFALAVQVDGKILVGGEFYDAVSGNINNYLGRFNADGTLDTNFNYGAYRYVTCLALQADGKVLVGGDFDFLGGQDCMSLGRLNTDGTLDTTFTGFGPETGGWYYQPYVASLAVQTDGKLLVGGVFSSRGGHSLSNIFELNNTDPATQSLTFNGSTLTWMRGGTSPEVWRTTFESSPNGVSWTYLGAGSRIAGGWQLTGIALPMSTTFRARGYTRDGAGSSWFVETILPGAPELSITPSGTNFLLTWPTNATGFTLQSTQFLTSSPVWTTVSPAPVVVNGQNTVTIPISDTGRFYRLIR